MKIYWHNIFYMKSAEFWKSLNLRNMLRCFIKKKNAIPLKPKIDKNSVSKRIYQIFLNLNKFINLFFIFFFYNLPFLPYLSLRQMSWNLKAKWTIWSNFRLNLDIHKRSNLIMIKGKPVITEGKVRLSKY